jgi:hypothetical protein
MNSKLDYMNEWENIHLYLTLCMYICMSAYVYVNAPVQAHVLVCVSMSAYILRQHGMQRNKTYKTHAC